MDLLPVASEIGGSQFQDLSGEVPTEAEWDRAQNPMLEQPPVRFRFRGKRASPEPAEVLDEPDTGGAASSRSRALFSDLNNSLHEVIPGEKWYDKVPETAWFSETSEYWQDKSAAVEIEIPLPDSIGPAWNRPRRILKPTSLAL